MADTAWQDFPNQAVLNDTDTILARTAAGGGVEIAGSALAKKDAAGVFQLPGPVNMAGAKNALRLTLTCTNNESSWSLGDVLGSVDVYDSDASLAGPGVAARFAVVSSNAGSGGLADIVFYNRYYTSGTAAPLTEMLRITRDSDVRPGGDNTQKLGNPTYRWSVVYAGTGSISTSDAREKQQIGAIPEAWLNAWADVQWCLFKFNDSVAAKGTASARWHAGLVAQQVRDAFAAHGLDAAEIGLIGLLCYDAWEGTPAQPQIVDEAGNEVAPAQPAGEAGDRWGLRYEECFAVEAAYQRRRMAAIEARLAALEGSGA